MTAEQHEVLQVTSFPASTNEDLAARFQVHKLYEAADPAAMIAELSGCLRAIVTTMPQGADRALIESFPKLEIISAYGVGVDPIDTGCAAERGVIVSNTPDVLTDCVADLGMGLLVAISRRIVADDRYVREGRWVDPANIPLATGLKGKTVGIVGFGRIGKEVAKRAEAFGMKIAYHGRHRQDGVSHPYHGEAAALAGACDYLMLCCPGGPETHHLVNATVLAALGSNGFLINIARGSVVDQNALVEVLVESRIAGAALDVFEDEPNVPTALFGLENVIVQPHTASATWETRTAMGDLMIENLLRHFDGQPVLTRVA